MKPAKPYRALTANQKAILACIQQSLADRGYPPSLREIAKETRIGLTTVFQNTAHLAGWGYIRQDKGVRRGIQLLVTPSGRQLSNNVLTISVNLMHDRERLLSEAHAGMKQLQALIASLEHTSRTEGV